MAVVQPVIVSVNDLQNEAMSFEMLQEAFGPDSLGILIVKDVPEQFPELRHRLLSYASYLGNMDKSDLEKITNEKAKFLVGWSRGREKLKNGAADELKGSFYANCAFYSDPTREAATLSAQYSPEDFPEYLAPNVWPSQQMLPGFQKTMESLCRIVIDVAVLVARACDRFAEADIAEYPRGHLERVVRTSSTTKARLLHYYPLTNDTGSAEEDNWCAEHKDHGCLTGLTSAMFVDEAKVDQKSRVPEQGADGLLLPPLEEMPESPDPRAGLWIKSRRGDSIQVKIPRGCIAFQTGEALERITRGKFRAVEHSVRGACAKGVARNTLAVFTQPNLDEEVDLDHHITFGKFAREIVTRNTI